MANFTLKQLRYFEALARHGNFGRAAEACSVSQPALSMQIMELEQSVGVQLFERVPKSVRLTGFGEEFASRVRAILQSVDELDELARSQGSVLNGRLRIGIIPTIAPYLLPAILDNLERTYPALDIHIRESVTPRLLRELADGRIDTAILALPVSEASLSEIALFDEPFLLVRTIEQAGHPVPDGEALQKQRLLLLEEGHCFRDQALSFCGVNSGMPRDGLDGSSLSTLVQMVGAGIGVTLIPEMAADVEARSAPVSLTRFPNPEPSRTVGMVWRKTSPLAPQLAQIGEIVKEAGLKQRRGMKAATGYPNRSEPSPSDPLNGDGNALPHTDAHGRQRVFAARFKQFQRRSAGDPGT